MVETRTVSVVRNVVFLEAGQLGMVEGHAVIVAVLVVKTVDVVRAGPAEIDVVASVLGAILVTAELAGRPVGGRFEEPGVTTGAAVGLPSVRVRDNADEEMSGGADEATTDEGPGSETGTTTGVVTGVKAV